MRLLFLTNLYPPYGKGGYEEWCQEVATHLRKHGHEIIVLTSDYGRKVAVEDEELADPNWVRRELRLEMDFASLRNGFQFFTARQQRSHENFETLRTYIRRFQPEAIVVWGMWNIVRALPILAEKLLPGRVIYYMGDYWPTLPSQFEFYWKAPAQHWYTQLPKNILGFFANAMLASEEMPQPAFERVIFPTIFMRNELVKRGVRPHESIVIYGAADTAPYDIADRQRPNGVANGVDHQRISPTLPPSNADHRQYQPPAGTVTTETLTLLWAGRLRADKGAHTAIKALAQLVHHEQMANLRLLIAGSGESDYQTFLDYLVRKERLQSHVTFLGYQQKEAMPELYRQADIFLFTSIWQEPFGRVLIEAMAAGATVVGSTVGGASEILVEDENSLTYPPGDVDKLAAQLSRLVRSPELRHSLAQAGKRTALEQFDIQRMASEIETYIKAVVKRAAAAPR